MAFKTALRVLLVGALFASETAGRPLDAYEIRVERARQRCRGAQEADDDFDPSDPVPDCEPAMEALFSRDRKDDIVLMFDDAIMLRLRDCDAKPCPPTTERTTRDDAKDDTRQV